MTSQRSFRKKASCRSAAVLTGAALTAGLLVFPTWADSQWFDGSQAAAVYEDTTPPEDAPVDPLAEAVAEIAIAVVPSPRRARA